MKSDNELVEEVKSGRIAAFAELVERHQRALLRLCLRLLKDIERSEDVVQDAFVKAYQKIHLFEGRSSFKNWLYQIALNTAKNKIRATANAVSFETVDVLVQAQAHVALEKA